MENLQNGYATEELLKFKKLHKIDSTSERVFDLLELESEI